MASVVAESLEKRYGDVPALEDLSFDIPAGTMYGLIGPDGAGKTTFMRIAACLMLQDGGVLTVDGQDTRRNAGRVQRLIGYMPQDFSLYPDLSVMENLHFFSQIYGIVRDERERQIEELLSFSRLGPFTGRRAGQLSGGMKKKLALSCTLVHTPAVLLLDEPTTGVDPVSRREFWGLLADIKQQGTTIIVSTPYMDEAERCDHVGFISGGRLILEGTPADIPGMFVREIIEVRGQDIVRRTRGLAFPEAVTDVRAFGDRLHLTVAEASAATGTVQAFLTQNGITDAAVDHAVPSMEDVFVERMGHA